jgi:hypothetical protein
VYPTLATSHSLLLSLLLVDTAVSLQLLTPAKREGGREREMAGAAEREATCGEAPPGS